MGKMEPLMIFSRVDLPAPLVPSKVTKSPSSSFKLMFLRICFSSFVPSLTVVVMFCKSKIVLMVFELLFSIIYVHGTFSQTMATSCR